MGHRTFPRGLVRRGWREENDVPDLQRPAGLHADDEVAAVGEARHGAGQHRLHGDPPGEHDDREGDQGDGEDVDQHPADRAHHDVVRSMPVRGVIVKVLAGAATVIVRPSRPGTLTAML